jgi:hypothetical protein
VPGIFAVNAAAVANPPTPSTATQPTAQPTTHGLPVARKSRPTETP